MVDPDQTSYPLAGEIIDEKYRVERLLGAGGMGAVVEATHLLRRAPVALKFMSARLVHDPAVVERFLNEGVAASRINNEHVVSVLDVSKLPSGQPYLVMEYLGGRDLAKLLAQEGTPGLSEVPRCVHFVLQVLRGLQVAHAAGIIHRDLKPANCIVVERDGEEDFLKICDFGISKVKTEPLNLTKVGSALGTPLYVSPEQARDPASVDARGDLYSVSVILYELLSGRTPFHPASGQLSELFMALATKDPQPLATLRGDLPAGLDAAILKGLAKTPDGRYRSAAEMAAALAPFSDLRSERVVRQLLQRSTLRPSGTAPPVEPAGRSSPGVSSAAGPLEKARATAWGTAVSPPSGRAPSPPSGRAPSPPTAWDPGSPTAGDPAGSERAAAAPLDTAAPTSLPAFFRRRQTGLRIALPLLVALLLAAVLFEAMHGPSSPPGAEPIAAPAAIERVEPPGELPVAAVPAAIPPAAPAPTIRVIPGASLPDPPASAAATPPTLSPSPPRAGTRAVPHSAPPSRTPPGKRPRPSLKQIGIEE